MTPSRPASAFNHQHICTGRSSAERDVRYRQAATRSDPPDTHVRTVRRLRLLIAAAAELPQCAMNIYQPVRCAHARQGRAAIQ